MKKRRHHNNKGTRQIKRGKTAKQVAQIGRRLKIPTALQTPATLRAVEQAELIVQLSTTWLKFPDWTLGKLLHVAAADTPIDELEDAFVARQLQGLAVGRSLRVTKVGVDDDEDTPTTPLA